MRAFSGLLKPIGDESLSSWLSRMYHQHYVDSTFETEILRLAARDSSVKGDLDLLYKSSAFLDLFSRTQRPQILAQFRMVESNTVPLGLGDKYCRLCFQNDISARQSPIWRKSWRMRGASVCVLHDRPVLLSRLIERPKDLRDRGWQGFQEYLDSPLSRLDVDFALRRAPPHTVIANNRKLLLLTQRVQLWYQRAFCDEAGNSQAGRGLQFLMSLWLHQPVYKQLSPGIARAYFRASTFRYPSISVTEKITSPQVSIDTASPRDLAVAYWLMGIAYGLITQEEGKLINQITRSEIAVFPTTRLQVAAATTRNYLEAGLAEILKEANESLAPEEFQAISWVFVRLLRAKDAP
ncbi:TniQ family protein [Pseudomonas sp. RTC3]|uniref:TniQ family protein n=1 Tax=Pseudomonas sp. 5C2 TaxID=3048588 RepID=UPI002AB3E05C|nr:TniQ family protein [Pseudomonas sp. 5C2]MDY7564710.1 TniQ family protein [Pseudomonas sp. 5C2]MEB0065066.1 TniQ family protein [Pseudomonas sp. RTC3]MEB0243708.1 TniQ family protein [Pseudomonas sp. 5C2]